MNVACSLSNHKVYAFLFCASVLHHLLYLEAIKTLFILYYFYLILTQWRKMLGIKRRMEEAIT